MQIFLLLGCVTVTLSRNPGYVIRVTTGGLDYAAQVGGGIVSNFIKKIAIPDVPFSSKSVSITLKDIKIASFDNAKWAVNLAPTSTVVLRLSNANLDAKGDFDGKVLLSHISGHVEATAKGIGIIVAVRLGADATGRPRVEETSCTASTANFDIQFSGSTLVKIINWFHKQIADAVKPDILNAICTEVQAEVNTNLQQVISTLPTVIDLGKGFGLDYRLKSVVATPKYLEISGVGEIDFDGKNMDPAEAPALDRSGAGDSLMAYFWGSQYIASSAAYQLHNAGVLHLDVTKEKIPKAASLLATTCQALCVGTIIKEIGQDYPNTYTGLSVASVNVPQISCSSAGGVLSARASIDLSVEVNGTYESLAGADLNITADLVPHLSGNNITGKVSITNMQIAGTYSHMVNPVNWQFLAHLTENILQNEINHVLGQGIPIPSLEGLSLVSPYLALKDKTLEVATNFHYQPQ